MTIKIKKHIFKSVWKYIFWERDKEIDIRADGGKYVDRDRYGYGDKDNDEDEDEDAER